MKINTLNLQQQEDKFSQNLEYEEWLRYNNPEPTAIELENMNKVFCKNNILKQSFYTKHSINKYNYHELQGA